MTELELGLNSIGSGSAAEAESAFRHSLDEKQAPSVLELGTLRWSPNNPTHRKDWVPHASRYVMSDFQPGVDVDVVADAHDLSPFSDGEFDAYMAISVYEHLRRPWIAAEAARRVLSPGGIALIVTHHTFPLHGYPSDFFRFSDRALAGIFEDAGFEIIDAGYQYPCQIQPPKEVKAWNKAAPCYLNVGIFAKAKPV